MRRLALLVLCCLLLLGCGTEVDMKEGETLQMGQVTAMPKASPVPPDGGMGEVSAKQTEGVKRSPISHTKTPFPVIR